jgi:tripartite motif-containing protein 71
MRAPRHVGLLLAAALALTGLVPAATADDRTDVDAEAPPRARALQYAGEFAGPGLADLTPVDVAVSDSSYYALDVARYRVVRVDRSTGKVTATVGGGRGDAPGELAAARSIARASNGDLYVADTPNQRVSVYNKRLRFKFSFGVRGAGAGQFDQVYGLAIGRGRVGRAMTEVVYTVDGDGRIQKWRLDGTLVGTFATGVSLHEPRMAEVNPDTKDLWVVSARDRQVVVIDRRGRERFRFGRRGSGPGQFEGDPRGIAINAAGTRVYVSDEGNHRIQVFNKAGRFKATIERPEGRRFALVDARGLEVAGKRLVVSDEWDYSLKVYRASDGKAIEKLFGGGPPLGGVNTPRGLALDAHGHVFVSDWWNQRIHRWNSDGSGAFAFGFRGTTEEPGSINFAWDVAVQPGTGRLFVANRESHEIEVFTEDGTFVARWGVRGSAPGEFVFPQGLDFAPDGTLVVSDSGNSRIQRFTISRSGQGTPAAAPGDAAGRFDTPTGVAVTPSGNVWVADTGSNLVQRLDATTGRWTAYPMPGGGSVNYRRPWGVTANPDGTVWVTDSGRGRIVLVDGNGDQIEVATGEEMGAGPLNQAFDTLVLPNGNLLVSDAFNNRIIEVRRTG